MEENDTRSTEIPEQETGGNDTFPIGLKVLAIDSNVDYLNHLVGLLRVCQYKVTGTSEAAEAIKLLNDKKEAFEIVIAKVVNLDMDAFKLLEIIGLGMDIPVVVVSENDDVHVVMRAVREGAAAYLQAPVRLQELKVIWQHVLRKRLGRKRQGVEYREPRTTDNGASFLLSRKKPRVNWSKELHVRFVEAFEQLGEKERGPNNILRLMNVPGLTRDNIASHLQKHRQALRKKATEVGKLDSRRNYYLGKTTSSVARSLLTSGQFQYPRSTCTAAGSFTPVPQFNSLKFPSNPWDGYSGIGPNDINPAYYQQLPSSWSSTSQTSDNYSSEIGGSPQQPVPIAGPFLSNNTVGQYCQPQFAMGSSQSSLTEDDLSEIFKLIIPLRLIPQDMNEWR